MLGIYESEPLPEAVQLKKHTWQIYGAQGHDRFGKVTPKPYLVHYITPPDTTMFLRELRQKFYEHKDHLGNVRMIFSDMKNRTATGIFYLDSLTARDYYPYGMLKPDRNYEDAWSRYGFNGMEKDDDIKGKGNSYDFGARVYDPRTVRWNRLDPLALDYPALSGYSYCGGNPIALKDPDGKKLIDANGNIIVSPNYVLMPENKTIKYQGQIVKRQVNPVWMYTNTGKKVPAYIITITTKDNQGNFTNVIQNELSFDCHGYTKGNGVLFIDSGQPIEDLLEEDSGADVFEEGINEICEAKPGDIAVFFDENNTIIHTAIVNEDFTLTSKNGTFPLDNKSKLEDLINIYTNKKNGQQPFVLFVHPSEDRKIESLNGPANFGSSVYQQGIVDQAIQEDNKQNEKETIEEKPDQPDKKEDIKTE